MKKLILFASFFLSGSLHAAIFGPYIHSQSTLQSGATIYLSSGTILNFNTNTVKFSDGTSQTTASSGGGITPGATFYVNVTSTLQSGSTFFVSSGTVNTQLTVSSLTVRGRVSLAASASNTPGIFGSNSVLHGFNITATPSVGLIVNGLEGLTLFSSSLGIQKNTNMTGISGANSLTMLQNITNGFTSYTGMMISRINDPVSRFDVGYGVRHKSNEKAHYYVGITTDTTLDSFYLEPFVINVDTSSSNIGYVGINIATPTAALSVGGHIETSSTTFSGVASSPTVSACGTNPSVSGTDVSGKITAGSGGSLTSCTLNFGKAWNRAPACVAFGTVSPSTGTTTTTSFTFSNNSTDFSSGIIMYNCFGYQ